MIGWAPGDLAVCVDASPCFCGECGGLPMLLEVGRAYTVTCCGDDGYGPFLGFDVQVGPIECIACDEFSAGADRFRKIRPDVHEGNIDDWRDLVEFFTKRVNA